MFRSAAAGVTARRLILEAYHLQPYQLSGGPDWLDSDMFDFGARAANSSADENQLRLMLRALLSKRFQLALHSERKEMQIYALTVGKDGTKLREPGSPEGDRPTPDVVADFRAAQATGRGMRAMHLTWAMQTFVDSLNRGMAVGRPVVDRTGMKGTYVFVLEADADLDYKTVIEETFGLTFEPQEAAVDVYAIDHIEKPELN
jgi:uncharacterized protein (TIGR03435 family)